jgi:hypothetical protein
MFLSKMGFEFSEFARPQVSGKMTLLQEPMEWEHE